MGWNAGAITGADADTQILRYSDSNCCKRELKLCAGISAFVFTAAVFCRALCL